MDDRPIELTSLDGKYEVVAHTLGISVDDVQRIHEYYKQIRAANSEIRTQAIIYDAISLIRKENPNFPIQLKNAYKVSTAFANNGLTEKKKPNPYRSKSSGRIKYTAQQVIGVIESRQDLFLSSVSRHGLLQGYAKFAERLNRGLSDHELPIDWKWISKKLGDGTGKNAFDGGAISLLQLRPSVRKKLTRILQGQPLYPNKRKILACTDFMNGLIEFLDTWQSSSTMRGGFHKALSLFIKSWNNDAELGGKYFQLPTVLYPNPHQESLGSILKLKSFTVSDFLGGLGIPATAWKVGLDTNREKIVFSNFLHAETGERVSLTDFDIAQGVIRWKARSINKYPKILSVDQVQTLYEKYTLE